MSRSDARSNALRRRPARVVPATITGLLLLALGVGLVWTTVLRLRDDRWPSFLGRVNRWATALTWGSTTAILIALAVLLVGLIMVIAGAKPGFPNAVTLSTDPAEHVVSGVTELVMTRRAVAKLATSYAGQVDGVDSVSAAVSGRRVALAVRSPSEQRDQLRTAVTATVRDALSRAGIDPLPAVRTVVRTTRP